MVRMTLPKMASPWIRASIPLGLLLGVVLLAEAWGGYRYRGDRDGRETDLGRGAERRQRVLARLTQEPDLLINLDAADLPSSADMIRLGRKATPAIIGGLVNSMSPQVRATCAAVLTGTRDPAALDALIDALDDPNHEVRGLALRALGAVESRKAVPKLVALMNRRRSSYGLREEAVSALGRLGDPRAIEPLLSYFKQSWDAGAQRALWNLRRRLSDRNLRVLIVDPLKAADKHKAPPREVLAFSVERAGDLKIRAAVRPLQKLFESHEGLQNRVIYNLGRIGDRSAISFLRKRLDRTAAPRLINNVAFALERLGEDPAPFLREALTDRRAYIRFNAAFVVGDLRTKALLPELTAALSDRNDYVRSEVAVALAKLADPQAIEALEAAAQGSNPIVVRDAVLALAHIDYPRYHGRVVDTLVPSRVRSVRRKAVGFLASRGEPDPTVVSAVLGHLDPSRYGDSQLAIEFLRPFLDLDNPDATAFLLRLVASGDHRHDALVLLGRWADKRSQFVLRQWLNAPDGEQDQLLRAMGRLRDESSRALAERWRAQTKHATSRLYGAFALAALGDPAGVEQLVEVLENAPVELKRVAARLMTELPLNRVAGTHAKLEALLTHDDVYARLYAARVLIQEDHTGAFGRLDKELAKRVPFIRDEVLDIVERAPARHRDPILRAWRKPADPHLKRELDRILGQH